MIGPQILDQPVARHGFPGVQEQHCQEGTWLRCLQRDNPTVGYSFERTEYTKVHSSL
jgi:hypothetical protein